MRRFSAAEANGELYLGALTDELSDLAGLCVQVVSANIRPETNLFLLGAFLTFLGLAFFLRREIEELTVVQQPADRGFGIWSHFY